MSKPTAYLSRNGNGVLVLGLYNLSPEHFATLRPILLRNGDTVLHDLRSQAGVHVDFWNPEDRMVGLALYGTDPWLFIHGICNDIGMSSGQINAAIAEFAGG